MIFCSSRPCLTGLSLKKLPAPCDSAGSFLSNNESYTRAVSFICRKSSLNCTLITVNRTGALKPLSDHKQPFPVNASVAAFTAALYKDVYLVRLLNRRIKRPRSIISSAAAAAYTYGSVWVSSPVLGFDAPEDPAPGL